MNGIDELNGLLFAYEMSGDFEESEKSKELQHNIEKIFKPLLSNGIITRSMYFAIDEIISDMIIEAHCEAFKFGLVKGMGLKRDINNFIKTIK